MDKGLDVNINAELKADLQPVIESTPSALNKFFELLLGVRHAKKKHIIDMIEAQREKDKSAIIDGLAFFNIEKMKLEALDINADNNAISLIENTVTNDEVRNIINCSKHTVEALVDVTDIPEKDVSKNFFNRWRNEAKLIDDEYAQSIWGKILAEEIQHPNTISLRALDILKNLTSEEAELFNEMGQYVLYGAALLTGDHITDWQLRKLADSGLVNYAGIYRESKWSETTLTVDDNGPLQVPYVDCSNYFIHSTFGESEFKFAYMPLTDAGSSIYKIAEKNNKWDISIAIRVLFSNKMAPDRVTCYKFSDIASRKINTSDPKFYNRDDFKV